MIQPDLSREVRLTIPARQDYALVASMTLCGLGMAAGLDMDLLGDLRTVTCESMDCLLHQAGRPEWIGGTRMREGWPVVRWVPCARA